MLLAWQHLWTQVLQLPPLTRTQRTLNNNDNSNALNSQGFASMSKPRNKFINNSHRIEIHVKMKNYEMRFDKHTFRYYREYKEKDHSLQNYIFPN